MPCASPSVPSDAIVQIHDYLEVHPFTAAARYRPANKAELVRAVINSGTESLRALGTNYSLSSVGVADNVMSTNRLNLHLSQPLGGAQGVPAQRLRAGPDYLAQLAGHPRVVGRAFVHVEAGVKIKDLYVDLRGCGLDLPTAGDGGAQSLAGVLSTGTHGGDVLTPVLGDWVRAMHLVTSGGQEVWVTSANSPFAHPGVNGAPDLCGDARIIADDAVLHALRVGVGRFGVLYAILIEVLPAYGLLECYTQHTWPDLRTAIAGSAVTPSAQSGVFDTPFTDLDTGWFRAEARSRTLVRYSRLTPAPTDAVDMEYIGGPARPLALVAASIEPTLFRGMLDKLGVTALADAMRGGPPRPLHHLNIAISLAEPDKCWVRRRWKVPPTVPRVLQSGTAAPPDPIQKVVQNPAKHFQPTELIGPLQEMLKPDVGVFGGTWLPALAKCLGISAQAERIFQFRDEDIPHICGEHEKAGLTIFEALFMVLHKLATDPVLSPDSTRAVAFAVSQLVGGNTVNKFLRSGLASELLDNHDYTLDGAQVGNSIECFFDVAAHNPHLSFVDSVIALTSTHAPVYGYIGIRFMPRSAALLGMPRYATTASVEVATPRSRWEDVYAGFWNDLHALANASGAIAHWGQEFRQSASDVASRYGEDLMAWKRALGRIAGNASTFSTDFSRAHGLEPSFAGLVAEDDALECFMAALGWGGD